MSETMIRVCALGTVEVVCIIALIVIHFREKKMKKKTGVNPTYYSAVGDLLRGKRR